MIILVHISVNAYNLKMYIGERKGSLNDVSFILRFIVIMLIMYLYIHRAQKSKMRFGMDADLDGELTGMI